MLRSLTAVAVALTLALAIFLIVLLLPAPAAAQGYGGYSGYRSGYGYYPYYNYYGYPSYYGSTPYHCPQPAQSPASGSVDGLLKDLLIRKLAKELGIDDPAPAAPATAQRGAPGLTADEIARLKELLSKVK